MVEAPKISVLLGFSIWIFFASLYWLFELGLISVPHDFWKTIISPYLEEVESTWAIVSHGAGFCCFMWFLTRQSRWIWLSVLTGFSFLWICKAVGVPQQWWLTASNIFGGVLMVASLVMGLGVFSSLYMFSHLITFVKKGARRYPGLATDLRKHPLLKIVIPEQELRQAIEDRSLSHHHAAHHRRPSSAGSSSHVALWANNTPAECVFCKGNAVCSLPVCTIWKGDKGTAVDADPARSSCLKMHELQEQRDSATLEVSNLKQRLNAFEAALHASRIEGEEQRQIARHFNTDLVAMKEQFELLKAENDALRKQVAEANAHI